MNALLAALSLGLAAVVALAVPGGAGALLLGVAAAALAGFFVSRAQAERTFLLQVFVGGLLARMLVGVLIYALNLQEFFGGDAFQYDTFGHALAQSWKGDAVGGSLAATWTETAGSGWGMIYYVAGIYSIAGRNMLAVQFVNSVLGAATAVAVFLCAHQIYGNLRVAKVAALFVAFYPSLVLWSAQGLKDGPIVFLLAAIMLATLRLGQKLSVGSVVMLAASLAALLTMRFYIFYMVAAAVAGAFLVGMRTLSARSLARQFAAVAGVGLALTYFGILRSAGQQFETYGNLQRVQMSRADLASTAQSGFGRDVDVSTTGGALSAIPQGMAYLLFAPFPWQLGSLRQSITLPEMAVWWASFPLLILGLWYTGRYRLRAALPILIFAAMLTLAYSIFQGNVGTAYRQRSQLLVFYFILVAVGGVLLVERRELLQRRRIEAAQQAAFEAAYTAEGRRRYEQFKAEREPELEEIARRLSKMVNF